MPFIRFTKIVGEEDEDEEEEEEDIQKNNAKFQENIDGPKAIDQSLFKKYLIYSKAFVRPVLQAVDSEKVVLILHFYCYFYCYIYCFVSFILLLQNNLKIV